MRWNVLRKSVRNKDKELTTSARNLLVLAMDTQEDEEVRSTQGAVVEMKQLGRCDSEAAVLNL